MSRRLVGVLLAALALSATNAAAQVEIKSKATEITLTGRVHLQWNHSSIDDELSNEFLIRRARITAELDVNDWISGKVQPDFGEGEFSLKDAYLRLTFDPAFRVTLGQFKRPFDLFELTSSTKFLVIERAGGIRGLDTCSGPGGVCAYSRFTEKLEYSDRDIGLMLDGTPQAYGDGSIGVKYMVALTNGTGSDAGEENDAKSYSGRFEITPVEDLIIGANVGIHDYVMEVGETSEDEYAFAFGGDVEYGNYDEGLHIQAGVTAGDNWTNLDPMGDPSKFFTAQGIVSFKFPIEDSRFLEAIEPVGRVSWGDPDTDFDNDDGLLFTPGLAFFFSGRNKFAVNVDIYSPSEGDTEYSVKAQSYLHF